ncbi:hypothetical protein CVD28_19000 [Bacillus sp. M6-12]|nr:hypothetical protein CVD28_19000 [Bacillus sp. M6-12]
MAARDQGADVLLVTKGKFGYCGATASGIAELGGFLSANGYTDPEDNPDVFFQDIVSSSRGMADPSIVRVLVENSVRAFKELEDYGVRFERNEDGSYQQVHSEFTSKPRMHILKKHGIPIVRSLMEHVLKNGVRVIDHSMVTRLLVKENRVIGATIYTNRNELIYIQAKAVILGTGGAGQLFKFNMNTVEMTGDGYSLGYRAGAELMNMEYIQAGAGFIHPFRNILHPWAWPVMPRILNGNNEEFIEKYLPTGMTVEQCFTDRGTYFPFSTSHSSFHMDVAIKKEIMLGRGTKRGGVYLDYSRCESRDFGTGTELSSLWPHLKHWLLSRNIDVNKQLLEISIFGHAFNGGMRINEIAETKVEQLFAAGEGAAGPHGADRPGGQMLMTSQVFGRIAGEQAGRRTKTLAFEDAMQLAMEEEQRINAISKQNGSVRPKALFKEIQNVMWESLIVNRSKDGLNSNLKAVEEFRRELKYVKVENSSDIRKVLEMENMLEVGEIITNAALTREESRGSHYREDKPQKDDENWLNWIIVTKSDNGINLRVSENKNFSQFAKQV